MSPEKILSLLSVHYLNSKIKSYNSLPILPANMGNNFYFQFHDFLDGFDFKKEIDYNLFFEHAFSSGLKEKDLDIRKMKEYICLAIYLNFGNSFFEKDLSENILSDVEKISNQYSYINYLYSKRISIEDKSIIGNEINKIPSSCTGIEHSLRKGILIGLSSSSFNDLVRSNLYFGIENPIILLISYSVFNYSPDDSFMNYKVNF